MRDREVIISSSGSERSYTAKNSELILEVLLDIRDLMIEKKKHVETKMTEKSELNRITREFADKSREYIDGDDLKNFIDFEGAAYSLAITHGIKQGKVEWKKRCTF